MDGMKYMIMRIQNHGERVKMMKNTETTTNKQEEVKSKMSKMSKSVMKNQKEILTDKLKDWCDNQSDYLMSTTRNFSDFGNPNEKILLVYKKRKNPITKIIDMMGKTHIVGIRGNVSDTHYLILQVHPMRKKYNVTDRRIFSNQKTLGLTFDELITSITDESCGYDMFELTKVMGRIQSGCDDNGKWFHYNNNNELLTKESMEGVIL
jgi:hypothetical protein